jgi:hypothetical protein
MDRPASSRSGTCAQLEAECDDLLVEPTCLEVQRRGVASDQQAFATCDVSLEVADRPVDLLQQELALLRDLIGRCVGEQRDNPKATCPVLVE